MRSVFRAYKDYDMFGDTRDLYVPTIKPEFEYTMLQNTRCKAKRSGALTLWITMTDESPRHPCFNEIHSTCETGSKLPRALILVRMSYCSSMPRHQIGVECWAL